jgi:hypothetical protein
MPSSASILATGADNEVMSSIPVVCLLVVACACSAGRPVACNFFPEGQAAACVAAGDGSVTVLASSLAHASFGFGGFDAISIRGREGVYFVNRSGRTARAVMYDNGPDYLAEGLARTQRNGKMGFVNVQLDEVVPPVWDFASPFHNGVAMVCTGCAAKPIPPDGEHTQMSGGKWGYIDKNGKVLVPVTFDEKSLPAHDVAAKFVGR